MLTTVRHIFGRIMHSETALHGQWDKGRKNNLLFASSSIRRPTLRRYEPLDNGLKREVGYNEYSKAEKAAILASYNYDNQLKYQNQILLFMINLCEIMEFVTEQKNILHLDIKPENIMVTRYGKELVLIDFGRSKRVTVADRFASSGLDPIDYNQGETQEKQYEFGALGYAAPECFCEAAEGSEFPFSYSGQLGRMSLESDIFSFGATFWECLNMFYLNP